MLNEEIIDAMVRQAMDITRNAYLHHEEELAVGACVLASDGTMYTGCNVQNRMPQLCASAEQVAMYKALSDGKREFDGIVIIADTQEPYIPSGMSLQMLAEFEVPDVVMANLNGMVDQKPLDELLPYYHKMKENKRFSFDD
ncbi:cytidine deaminase [Selenomonas sp.]|uniref:cytidine deaminase n=1 Tax=Selenomonas sp. TaxID=2053611 RepID=UPI0025E359BF|nr:cytidine deaminase [Selenomonas sp.]MCI6086514.1 cytidine deaminase [Selenomonas sp.]MDY3297789.1 cytidine deaminase [Selenomonas sp.]MDY4415220.1 cytidine deaminase [Selenomonas sp.]